MYRTAVLWNNNNKKMFPHFVSLRYKERCRLSQSPRACYHKVETAISLHVVSGFLKAQLLLQGAAEKKCYYKVPQLYQYNMRQALLKAATGLNISTSVITKYSRRWYKNGIAGVILSILQYQTLENWETIGWFVRVSNTLGYIAKKEINK